MSRLKIDAPRTYTPTIYGGLCSYAVYSREHAREHLPDDPVVSTRIIRESDWRRIMAVTNAINDYVDDKPGNYWTTVLDTVHALRAHLEKRK
jgi:hypothetical protein